MLSNGERRKTMPDLDRNDAEDRDDLAREWRERQRQREEYLNDERETYGTED